jgi:hypothetical protein
VVDEFDHSNPSTAQFAQPQSAGRFYTMLEYISIFAMSNQQKIAKIKTFFDISYIKFAF